MENNGPFEQQNLEAGYSGHNPDYNNEVTTDISFVLRPEPITLHMRGAKLYKLPQGNSDYDTDLFLTSDKPYPADFTIPQTKTPFLCKTGKQFVSGQEEGGVIGFNKYTNDAGAHYYKSYPVTVINRESYSDYLKSLGKCLVVTGGCKLFNEDIFFSSESHKVMFLAGYEVGLQWDEKYVKQKGFKHVCTGCMIQDNTLPGPNTSKSFDFLFPYGFALGLKHARNHIMTDEEKLKEIEKHLEDMVTPLTPDKIPGWIHFAQEKLPVINIKDMSKCHQDANPKNSGELTDGKLTLLQDFWYSPFGQTVVFHPGVTEGGEIIKTTNSIKEYLLALCLKNDDGGLVIAASGGPTVTQNIIMYTCQNPNVYTYSIAGSNTPKNAGTGAIPPSLKNRTTEDSFKALLDGRLNDKSESGELYIEIEKLLGPDVAKTARETVKQAQKKIKENRFAERLNYLTIDDGLVTQLDFETNTSRQYDWNGFTSLRTLMKYGRESIGLITGNTETNPKSTSRRSMFGLGLGRKTGGSRKRRTRKIKRAVKVSRKNNRRVNVSRNKTQKRKRVRTRRINQSNA